MVGLHVRLEPSVLRLKFVAEVYAADMARMGRPKATLTLTEEQQVQLMRGARAATSTQAFALRCRIVLACADPEAANSHIAAELGVSVPTIAKWRKRFIAHGMAGLADEPRVGRPPSILLDRVEEVVTLTLETLPHNATHWSRTSMAERSGLSKSTIGRIWRRFDLKPHQIDGFKLSTDPQFVAKVVDVIGLYHNPPERAVVLCVDEKSQMQALDRSQPVLPMMPGMPERRTHDYSRHGTTSLFAAFNIADGTVIGELHRKHRAVEYRKFLIAIDKAVPADLDVHIVCDNLATHKTALVHDWLARHPRFHVHFTPTGSSWINQVERWFGYLTDQVTRRGVHKSVQALEADVRAWIEDWNSHPKPFVWKKTAEEILDSLGRYLQRISGAGH
jgi:transposase